jgi:hypothetical protein
VSDLEIRRAQTLFREVNERIAEITREQQETVSDFLCECGRTDCTSVVRLELPDYQVVRSATANFVSAPGHCVDGVDRLAYSRDGYDVLVQI